MGDVFGTVGSIISSKNTEDAVQQATDWQSKAIQNSINNVNQNMDPSVVNQQAINAGQQSINASMAEQQAIDPTLAALRGTSEQDLANKNQQMQNLTDPGSQANQVATAATQGALNQPAGLQTGTNALIDAALQEVKQGATLPPDLQAEMMQSGLQTGAQSYGHATGQGAGGTVLNQVLGSAGVALQQQRQQQASNLLSSASNLNAQRQSILSSLFPSLATTQLNQTGAGLQSAAGALGTSNSMMPNLGLSGSDAANIWLNRIGAQNQLGQEKAQVQATGKMGTTQAQNEMTAGYASLASTLSGQNLVNGVLNYALGSNFGGVGGSGGGGGKGGGLGGIMALL